MVDLKGKRFGKLMVLERCNDKPAYWICQCDCGNRKNVLTGDLLRKRGGTKSCGCLSKSNLIGQKFGRLTVIEEVVDKRKKKQSAKSWLCECDCGNTTIVYTGQLTGGYIKNCPKCIYVYGTSFPKIRDYGVLKSNNTSGCAGVTWIKAQRLHL